MTIQQIIKTHGNYCSINNYYHLSTCYLDPNDNTVRTFDDSLITKSMEQEIIEVFS